MGNSQPVNKAFSLHTYNSKPAHRSDTVQPISMKFSINHRIGLGSDFAKYKSDWIYILSNTICLAAIAIMHY